MDEARGPSRLGRRALIAGAAAGAATAIAGAILHPEPAEAGGGVLVLGDINEAGGSTRLYTPSFSNYNRAVMLNGPGYAVHASNQQSDGAGVRAYASGGNGVAVSATTDGHWSTTALQATSDPEGLAVDARTVNGTGVRARAAGGYALDVEGRTVFSRSGKVVFAAGQGLRTVTRQGAANYIGPATILLATIQGYVAGVWVAGVVRNGDQQFTIRLNKAAPVQLVVGWFAVN